MIEFESETDRETFMDGIKEISNEYSKQDDIKDQVKDIIDALYGTTKIPKPLIRKVARLYHRKAGAAFEAETSEIKSLYRTLTEAKKSA